MASILCLRPDGCILWGRTNFSIKTLLIKLKFPTFTVLLFPHNLFFIFSPILLFFCLATLQQAPISTERRLPTQLSLTHAPYVPQFIHEASGTHIVIKVSSAASGMRQWHPEFPLSTTTITTPFPAHSTQPAIIKQTGLFVTSWFTHQQVIFSDFAVDGFALLTLNKNSSPKIAE